MENIKQNFSIKDLENLSGIKAHTIRMWEKRYEIFHPKRTATNIRFYDSSTLQKILNIALLTENGYKISRISKLSDSEINNLVSKVGSKPAAQTRIINSFKLAMMRFNEDDFEQTYQELTSNNDFEAIFQHYFIPLLQEVGLLWQTDTLEPIHEHFLVNLIKEKLYANNLLLKSDKKNHPKNGTFILFLPENEIHDLSLLFLQHLLLKRNFNVIYLGQNLPLPDLSLVLKQYPDAQFVTYCTIAPQNITVFIDHFNELTANNKACTLHILGHKAIDFSEYAGSPTIEIYQNHENFISTIS